MSNLYWTYPNTVGLCINKIIKLILASLLVLTFFHKDVNANNTGIIKIPKHNWSSQMVGAEIIGELMKMIGEEVEYVSTDPQTVYQSMADGEIDIVHEIWEIAFGVSYERAKENGGIEEILTHDAVGREGWWYPDYVEKDCPGMPDWKALAKCSDKFARPYSDGKGVFFSGPIDWKKHDAEIVKALGLNFIIKNTASPEAIWKELDTSVKQKKPVIIFNWSPSFVGAKYSGEYVEFPKYDPKCTKDPSWGVNPNAIYDCGYHTVGYIKLAVNSDFKKNHPKAYKVIKQMNFSGPDIDKMANYVDTDGLKISLAAQQWLRDHKDKWSKWVEKSNE